MEMLKQGEIGTESSHHESALKSHNEVLHIN